MSGGQRVIAANINGGRIYPFPDDPILHPINATYGDEFQVSTLNAAWTTRNLAGGDVVFPYGAPGVRLAFDAVGDAILRAAPAGDFEIVVSMQGGYSPAQGQIIGPVILDSSGNGFGVSWYPDSGGSIWNWAVASYAYSASGNNVTGLGYPFGMGNPFYLGLRKTGTSYQSRFSKDGITWTALTTANTSAITPANIGVCRLFAGAGDSQFYLRRFNVYAGPTFYVP